MVLLIPAAVKKLKAEGRKEGHKEGRLEERQRTRNVLANLAAPAGGEPVLLTPEEVMKILHGEEDGSRS